MEEIFARTINAVCAETGVSREDILSGKHDESTVDARYLLVHILYRQGLYPSVIASRTGLCRRTVNYAVARFNDRARGRRILGIMLARVTHNLGII